MAGSAITDATEAINLDPNYIKVIIIPKIDFNLLLDCGLTTSYIGLLQGYYRRGTAHLALNKLKLAKADFR